MLQFTAAAALAVIACFSWSISRSSSVVPVSWSEGQFADALFGQFALGDIEMRADRSA